MRGPSISTVRQVNKEFQYWSRGFGAFARRIREVWVRDRYRFGGSHLSFHLVMRNERPRSQPRVSDVVVW